MAKKLFLILGGLVLACTPFPGSPSPSAAPTSVSCKGAAPVYHPARLTALGACVKYRGWVIADLHEKDGDRHLWIVPDAGYEHFLNAQNQLNGVKALVVEIVPACTSQPSSASVAAQCPPSKLPAPVVKTHVEVVGPWVLDTNHGWNEVHPVVHESVLAGTPPPGLTIPEISSADDD